LEKWRFLFGCVCQHDLRRWKLASWCNGEMLGTCGTFPFINKSSAGSRERGERCLPAAVTDSKVLVHAGGLMFDSWRKRPSGCEYHTFQGI